MYQLHALILLLCMIMFGASLRFSRRPLTDLRFLSRTMCTSSAHSKLGPKTRPALDGKTKSKGPRTRPESTHNSTKDHGFKGIVLTPAEKDLVHTLNQVIKKNNLRTVIRVAGGWVRDRLLGEPAKNDVDLALESMTGLAFSRCWDEWAKQFSIKDEKEKFSMHVIQKNPDRSKHLETVAIKYKELDIDIVNLRSEAYSDSSRIPEMQLGTPAEDALRRDLTINSLFYNIHTRKVEDFTGRGLQDLRDGIVRTPLPALVTLMDDPLRGFRIVRFACRFGFSIVPEAVQACRDASVHASLQQKVSRERTRAELMHMLRATFPTSRPIAVGGKKVAVVQPPSALRAVTLLHSLGLLRCLVTLPANLVRPHPAFSSQKGEWPLRGPIEVDVVSEKEIAALQENFVEEGVCTVQMAHYLRQILYTQPSIAAGDRLMHASAWMKSLAVGNEEALSFTIPALFTAAGGLYQLQLSKDGKVRNADGNKKQVGTFIESLLMKQFMFSAADSASATRTLAAAQQFRSRLEACIAQAHETANPSPTPANDSAENNSQSIPVACNGQLRQDLGLVVRFAGEHFPYAILLAAAQIARDRTVDALVLSAVGSGASNRAAVMARVSADLALFNGVDVDGGMLPVSSVGSARECKSDVIAVYEREARAALRGVEAMLEAIERMHLQQAWTLAPPYGGRALQGVFTKLPQQGIIYSEMMDTQLEWKLKNPRGTDEELLEYLKLAFKDLL